MRPEQRGKALMTTRDVFGKTGALLRELKDDLEEIEAPPWFQEKIVRLLRAMADDMEREVLSRDEPRLHVTRGLLWDAFGPRAAAGGGGDE